MKIRSTTILTVRHNGHRRHRRRRPGDDRQHDHEGRRDEDSPPGRQSRDHRLRRRERRRLCLAGAIRGEAQGFPGEHAAGRDRTGQGVADRPRRCAGWRPCWPWSMPATRCLVSGTGDVIQPTDGMLGIGSGGSYAVAAARALVGHSRSLGRGDRPHVARNRRPASTSTRTPTSSSRSCHARPDASRDRRRAGSAHRRPGPPPSGPWRSRSAIAGAGSSLPEEMRPEVAPKNILMIGPTGVGKTEIARRLAKLTGAPFIKVEATKYTEVGYYGRDVESMVRELVENAIGLVRERERKSVEDEARRRVEERLARSAGPAAGQLRRGRRKPRDARASRADPREDAGDARRGRTGSAQGRTDDRAEGHAHDVHRHGHGAGRSRPAGDVRKDPAEEHVAARDDAWPKPAACSSSRSAMR